MKKRGETQKFQWCDLTGKKFGKLTAQWPAGRHRTRGIRWLCSCECGNIVPSASAERLNSGWTQSCGCAPKHQTHGKSKTIEYIMWKCAQQRAHRKNIPFNISHDDVVMPEKCPLLGILLQRQKGRLFHDSSPSLDRIKPELGYVKGNIQVISFRANRIKCNATLDELETIVQNWRNQTCAF